MKTLIRIAIKGLILFIAFVVVFVLVNPLPGLGRLSLYNSVFPGRQRLPWGENAALAYNLTLNNLDAMFASHEISQPKDADEFRVVLIGDSSTWGFLLRPEDTLAAKLNAKNLSTADGRQMRFYNVGYPDFSLTKDALLLSRAMQYQPDLVVWLVTLRSFPIAAQPHALTQANVAEAGVIAPQRPITSTSDQNGVASTRRNWADLIRLQLYGVMWAATGVDQYLPATYEPLQRDFEADDSFFNLKKPLRQEDLALDVLAAGKRIAGNVPLVVVNEPMFVSDGRNSDIRYNFFYPRWAYDQYRALMPQQAAAQGWRYLDLWNLVPPAEFTNSAVHLTPAGSQLLADALAGELP